MYDLAYRLFEGPTASRARALAVRRLTAPRGAEDGARAAECIVGNVGGLEVKGWSVMTAELKPLRD